eukprot:1155599-Pelagomonas_calceolata.AAC.4
MPLSRSAHFHNEHDLIRNAKGPGLGKHKPATQSRHFRPPVWLGGVHCREHTHDLGQKNSGKLTCQAAQKVQEATHTPGGPRTPWIWSCKGGLDTTRLQREGCQTIQGVLNMRQSRAVWILFTTGPIFVCVDPGGSIGQAGIPGLLAFVSAICLVQKVQ